MIHLHPFLGAGDGGAGEKPSPGLSVRALYPGPGRLSTATSTWSDLLAVGKFTDGRVQVRGKMRYNGPDRHQQGAGAYAKLAGRKE